MSRSDAASSSALMSNPLSRVSPLRGFSRSPPRPGKLDPEPIGNHPQSRVHGPDVEVGDAAIFTSLPNERARFPKGNAAAIAH